MVAREGGLAWCTGKGANQQQATTPQMRDRARRFISLLDELYNARSRLIVSAASLPHLLFQKPGDVPILDLESLQFETAVEGTLELQCALQHTSMGACK